MSESDLNHLAGISFAPNGYCVVALEHHRVANDVRERDLGAGQSRGHQQSCECLDLK